MPSLSDTNRSPDALSCALGACKNGLKAVILFSLCINLLTLAAPLYMLQVFDRVIGSGSTDTLLYLTLITLGAIGTLAALEVIRSRVMVKLGLWLEQQLSQPVFSSSVELAAGSQQTCTVQGLRDVATLRNFLTGPAVFPILDAPWFPIFLAILFLLHPLLGWIALGGALLLFALAIANDLISREPLQESAKASIEGLKQAESAVRNAHVVKAMGLMENLHRRWRNDNDRALGQLAEASYRSGALSSLSKFIRQALQVTMMGTGAWLVLQAELTAGGMITGSILLGRALAPIDQAIGSWKGAVAARGAMARIRALLASQPEQAEPLELPEPTGTISVEKLVYGYSLSHEPVLRGLSFELEAGETLGVIGPTATGKSTLASLLVGTLQPEAGHVRIDGADLYRWNTQANGHLLGYLPQNVELFEGSVAENIARMGEIDAEAVVAAARAADVHETILALPEGYETNIGENGAVLSGGQRQRVALARALYGDPRLVVLDEPNASLDLSGDSALVAALQRLKEQKISTVIITHRPSILKNADKVLILYPGGRFEFGPRDQMLKSVVAASTPAQQPIQEKAHVRAQ